MCDNNSVSLLIWLWTSYNDIINIFPRHSRRVRSASFATTHYLLKRRLTFNYNIRTRQNNNTYVDQRHYNFYDRTTALYLNCLRADVTIMHPAERRDRHIVYLCAAMVNRGRDLSRRQLSSEWPRRRQRSAIGKQTRRLESVTASCRRGQPFSTLFHT